MSVWRPYSILLNIFWSDLSGTMRKVYYDQTFFSLFWMAVVCMFTSYVYVICFISQHHKDGYCNWCLLIPMNKKDWYFFLWKKKYQLNMSFSILVSINIKFFLANLTRFIYSRILWYELENLLILCI